jgi:hypothetical protein
MNLLITPTYQTSKADLDYESSEEESNNAVLFNQGFSSQELTVEDGEKFEIEEGYTASFIEEEDDDTEYYWGNPEDVDSMESDPYGPIEELEAGKYKLEGNNIFISEEDVSR